LFNTGGLDLDRSVDGDAILQTGHELRRRIALFSAIIIVAMVALVALVIAEQRSAALERARADASNLSAAFEEQVRRVMDGVAGAMDLLKQRIEVEGSSFDLTTWTRLVPGLATSTIQVAVIGPDGILKATTREKSSKPVDLSDREHFRVHRDNAHLGLFIGKPMRGRVSKQLTIQVSKRLETAGGAFAGVLVFSLDPESLTTLHKSVDLGESGSLTLAGQDGIIRARLDSAGDRRPNAIGSSIEGAKALFDAASANSGAYMAENRIDGTSRLFHWRKVAGYPLIVIAGLGKEEVLATANRHALMILALGGVAILLAGFMAVMLMREISRRVRHEIAFHRKGDRLKQANESLTLQHSAMLITSAELAEERINLQRINAELSLATKRSEVASRAKTAFLANMSHELRTPLNAIIGFSEIIRDKMFGPASPRYFEYAADIQKAGAHLLAIINDILDVAKIEAGKVELVESVVNLTAILEASLRSVQIQADQSQLLIVRKYFVSDIQVRCDEKRLKQIFINILSNAVKFTQPGGRVELRSEVDADGCVSVVVQDTGIGMSESEIQAALENFRQIDNGLAKQYEGTGLGLPLARLLTGLHDGSLTIKSASQVGTEVCIRLPSNRVQVRTPQWCTSTEATSVYPGNRVTVRSC
jgi:signal transduction histidine kinase